MPKRAKESSFVLEEEAPLSQKKTSKSSLQRARTHANLGERKYFDSTPIIEEDSLEKKKTKQRNCICCQRVLESVDRRKCTKCRCIVCSACSKTKIPDAVTSKPQRICDTCISEAKRTKYEEMRRSAASKRSSRASLHMLAVTPHGCPAVQFDPTEEEALQRMAQDVRETLQATKFKRQDMVWEDLDEIQLLGRGATGRVALIQHKPSGQYCAAKTIPLKLELEVSIIKRELQALQLLSHRNLVSGLAAFVIGSDVQVIFEYMDCGSLQDLAKCGAVPDNFLSHVAHEVLAGLAFLHQPAPDLGKEAMLHRDIKPANVLLNGRGEVKIADFGIVTALKNSMNSFVGTGKYMSPERMRGDKYGATADIWSLGITLAELALRRSPFDDTRSRNFMGLYTEITNLRALVLPTGHSLVATEFINACLVQDPFGRPSAVELQGHAWMQARASQEEFASWLIVQSPNFLSPTSSASTEELTGRSSGAGSPPTGSARPSRQRLSLLALQGNSLSVCSGLTPQRSPKGSLPSDASPTPWALMVSPRSRSPATPNAPEKPPHTPGDSDPEAEPPRALPRRPATSGADGSHHRFVGRPEHPISPTPPARGPSGPGDPVAALRSQLQHLGMPRVGAHRDVAFPSDPPSSGRPIACG